MAKLSRAEQDARLKRYFSEAFRKYGITETQFRELWTAQNGRCSICQRKFLTKLPAIDHDHVTGFVRGLLCGGSFDTKTCNRLIGLHSTETLQRAADYKRNPPAFAVIGRIKPGTMEKAS